MKFFLNKKLVKAPGMKECAFCFKEGHTYAKCRLREQKGDNDDAIIRHELIKCLSTINYKLAHKDDNQKKQGKGRGFQQKQKKKQVYANIADFDNSSVDQSTSSSSTSSSSGQRRTRSRSNSSGGHKKARESSSSSRYSSFSASLLYDHDLDCFAGHVFNSIEHAKNCTKGGHSNISSPAFWVVDSGCSRHMSGYKRLFVQGSLQRVSNVKVKFGDEKFLTATHCGTIKLPNGKL